MNASLLAPWPRASVAASLLAISACGGGGGSDAPAPQPANRAPTIAGASITTDEDVAAALQLAATDPDGNAIAFSVTTPPQHGTATTTAAGALVYTPAPNYSGADAFGVTANDGAGGVATATINATVRAVNDLPVLTSTGFTMNEDGVLVAQLTGTDAEGDAFTFHYQPPTALNGSITIDASGAFTFTPLPDLAGQQDLPVRLVETVSSASTPVRTAVILVNNVNDAPVAVADTFRVNVGAALPLLANDTDVDGNPLEVQIVDPPRGGTVSVNGAGAVVFTRENAFTGPIEFTYRVSDGTTTSATVTARGVIGGFQPLTFLADQTTVGRPEIHLFDGLTTRRLNADLPVDGFIEPWYTQNYSAQEIMYTVNRSNADQVYVVPVDGSRQARLVYTSEAKTAPTTRFTYGHVNRANTHALILDPHLAGDKKFVLVTLATGATERVGADEPAVVQMPYGVFGEQNDLYFQGQVGGTVPAQHTTEYYSLYRVSLATPRQMTQVGGSYLMSDGSGSGEVIVVGGPNGRYVYHGEVIRGPSPTFHMNTLVYDTQTGTNLPLRRRAMGTELGGLGPRAISRDLERVCFPISEPGSTAGFGHHRIWAGSGADPAAAFAVTPVAASVDTCHFMPDNHTIVYSGIAPPGPTVEVFAADLAAPGVSRRISRPASGSEENGRYWVARDAMRFVQSYRQLPAGPRHLYSLPVEGSDAPVRFLLDYENLLPASVPFFIDEIDAQGTQLAHLRVGTGGAVRLVVSSTQTLDGSIALTRADATVGVKHARWLAPYD